MINYFYINLLVIAKKKKKNNDLRKFNNIKDYQVKIMSFFFSQYL